MDLNALYHKARNGDRIAEKTLFDHLTARFLHFADLRIWNKSSVEEVVQEAMLAISKEYSTKNIEESFTAWAYKVLANRILHYIDSQKRRNKRSLSIGDIESIAALSPGHDPDIKRRLLSCLEKIGGSNINYARILNFHYQGYKTKEICEKMNITATNLYTILSRARSLLKLCLETGRIDR